MTEPLYSVGQHVAVCTRNLKVVIPATTVTACYWDEAGYFIPTGGDAPVWVPACWTYLVADHVLPLAEWTLRPINPDTEYQDISSSLKAPHSGMEEIAP